MALVPKKTYSRRNNELSVLSDKEKENVDPFDELLSSPLKQEVQFQPLSFWRKKVKPLDSNGKSEQNHRLFEASDSDEVNSPYQGKMKSKAKHTKSKAGTLQPKSKSLKLSRRKNYLSANSCIDEIKAFKPVNETKNRTLVCTDEIGKGRVCHLGNTLNPNEAMEETLNSSCKGCNSFEFINKETQFRKGDFITSFGGDLGSTSCSVKCKICEKNFNNSHSCINFLKSDNMSFKTNEDAYQGVSELQVNGASGEIFKSKEGFVHCTMHVNKIMEERLASFQSDCDKFKFVTVKRYLNYPGGITNESSSHLSEFKKFRSPIQLLSEPEESVSPIKLKCKNVNKCTECFGEFDDTAIYNGNTALHFNGSMDKTLCNEDSVLLLNERSKEISIKESQSENIPTGCLDSIYLSDSELKDIFLELRNVCLSEGVALETSLASNDTSSSSDGDTIIKVEQKSDGKNDLPLTDSDTENDAVHSINVSVLTTGISDMSISYASSGQLLSEPEVQKAGHFQRDSYCEDKQKCSFSVDLRNVTRKRRDAKNDTNKKNDCNRESLVDPNDPNKGKEADEEVAFDQTLWVPGRMSLDYNKSISFVNPVFESTRVIDMDLTKRKIGMNQFQSNESILEESLPEFGQTYILKPGKKWLRSRSVLKQIHNGSIAGVRLQSTTIRGRKSESFMRNVMESKNGNVTVPHRTLIGADVKNVEFSGLRKTLLECENPLEQISEKSNIDDSIFVKTLSNESVLEKSALSHTVKVIQKQEGSSAFRSALGLDNNHSLVHDSVIEGSSAISARDFILMQCGQEDILPFEEYFNERTLKDCKKIGEGVYGEVFLCSFTVLKIIPIEGSEKVNGEPQKTFEEITSEVVIASKLSGLRKGEKNRTSGFSEMKRCWCVKGKYPEHLLRLWNEYDQLGSGSENDSPIMFKNDQLYIILELANGGKDLESFVFTSSAQSLSVFIQTAFSLAVAEKAFEFEHRDLHWGNLLISQTKEKFVDVLLDGAEYKIPTKGVKVCIIDFTLSRINHEGCCIFNDLSVDPTLFASVGDYQFEIYRLMLREVTNDWSLFRPKTNLFWLHYILDKMQKMVRYKNKKAKAHAKHVKDLRTLECVVLRSNSSADFVLGSSLNGVMAKL